MNWTGLWEGIGSIFEDFLFPPFDALMKLELENWWLANFMSWIFIAIAASAFIYWMLQIIRDGENTDVTYTYDETKTIE